MGDDSDFVDFYRLLQVDYDCDERRLELAYHYFAKLYHPDSGETADVEKFGEVVQAYKVLRNADQRGQYNKLYFARNGIDPHVAGQQATDSANSTDALNDAEAHRQILQRLYDRRRKSAADPGIPAWVLEEDLDCSENRFEFLTWYLKSKGLVEITGQGTMAITVEGVDQVIANSRAIKEKLMIEDGSAATSQDLDGGKDREAG